MSIPSRLDADVIQVLQFLQQRISSGMDGSPLHPIWCPRIALSRAQKTPGGSTPTEYIDRPVDCPLAWKTALTDRQIHA